MKKFFRVAICLGCTASIGGASTPPAQAQESAATTQLVKSGYEKLRAAKTLNDYAAARKELLQAAAADPKSATAQFWLGESTRWATRLASTLATPDFGDANFDFALLDSDEAIRRYSLAITLDPKNARAYFGRGSFFLERSTPADDARAVSDFNQAITLDPKFASAYLGRALAQGRGPNPPLESLMADYNKAIALGIPQNGEDETYEKIIAPRLRGAAYAGRGSLYARQNQNEKALADFDRAISLDANALEARVQRAALLVKQNARDKAVADLNFVLEKQPASPSALIARADIYRQQNKREEARADMRRALQLNEQLAGSATDPVFAGIATSLEAQKRGDQWLGQGAFDEALTEYSRAIESDKENAGALAGRAAVKMRRADLAGAQIDLDAGLKLQPDNVKLLTTRGQVLARRGQFDAALADLEKATKIAPDDVTAWEQTGIVQQAKGSYAEAEKSYDNAIGFSALHFDRAAPSTFLAPIRRLIVRAVQGKDQTWEPELGKLPQRNMSVGIQLLEIELRKHPDSVALQNLRAAMNKVGNIF